MGHNPPSAKDGCAYTRCFRHYVAKTGDTEYPADEVACAECCPDCITERKEKMARMATEAKAAHKRDDGSWYIGDVRMAKAGNCGHVAIFCNSCILSDKPESALREASNLSCGIGKEACCCAKGNSGKMAAVAVLADGRVVRGPDRETLYKVLADPAVAAAAASVRRPQIGAAYDRPQRCSRCEGVKYLCIRCIDDVASGDGDRQDKSDCADCCCQRTIEGAILPNGEYVRGSRDECSTLISEGVDMGGKVIMPLTIGD